MKTKVLSVTLAIAVIITIFLSVKIFNLNVINSETKSTCNTTVSNAEYRGITQTYLISTSTKIEETTILNSRERVDIYLREYAAACNYNVDGIKSFSEKQTYIKNKLSKYFTDDAFKKTEYFNYCNMDESVTTANGEKYSKNIPSQSRKLENIYYNDVNNDSANAVMKSYNNRVNKKYYEYEYVRLKKINDEWIIVDYKLETE